MKFLKRERAYSDPKAWKATLLSFGYWLFAVLFWETLLHAVVYGAFSGKFGYVLGFSVAFAGVVALLLSFLPKKIQDIVMIVLTLAGVLLYGSQMVYNYVFGTMYSIALMEQGGAAVTSFWRETLSTIWGHLLTLLLLFVPLLALLFLRKKNTASSNLFCRAALALAAAAAYAATLGALQTAGTQMYSDYHFYHSNTIATHQNVQRFGLLTTFRLELFGSGTELQQSYYVSQEETQPVNAAEDVGVAEQAETVYNILEIDFDALSAGTDDEKRRALNEYMAAQTGTNQNDYTGLLEGYNLIVLCGESFSSAAIHPEVTPTLYKLANEGILFENYYNTFPNTTTDGEYALCQGLYPDSSRNKESSSMYASRNSYLPFTLGNVFREQLGFTSYGYHNYEGDYYGRKESHTNLGYEMKFAKDGMTFTNKWPASDLEMMEQSVDDYIGQEQFHAYYMTFSAHYQYNKDINVMAAKNWDVVKDLPYSDTSKAYLSCNVELDKAVEYLLRRLEEAGIADRTAIVLAGDHFPYGLTDDQYAELVGHPVDELSKFKDTLIFWAGGLKEKIVVEEYCCNVDILPTILNLWGLEYDSRMLAGTDVFSDGTHIAVLADRSFLTDKVWFNANTGEITYLTEESELPENYVDRMNRLVATKFSVSADILQTGYYNYVFDKGEAAVDLRGW